jgi:hypothetical protein
VFRKATRIFFVATVTSELELKFRPWDHPFSGLWFTPSHPLNPFDRTPAQSSEGYFENFVGT